MTADLDDAELARVLGDRPVRTFPALLSTESAAMSWARAGAPSGALVVADYQASPRGRGGLPWTVTPGHGLGFSLVLRPALPPEREGWPSVAASVALAEVLGEDAGVEWPDTVVDAEGRPLARVSAYVELGPERTEWVSLTILVIEAVPPRSTLLAEVVTALERLMSDPADPTLVEYLARCHTIGRRVRARMIPMGPGGPEVNGEAVDVIADGSLVVRTDRGSRVAVPPQNLGLLEAPEPPAQLPGEVARRLQERGN